MYKDNEALKIKNGAGKNRIQIIDAARGAAVVLMVIHHLLFDLTEFLGAPEWLFSNPIFNVLHYFFAGLFIFLCGVSSRFSRSNLKRGFMTVLAAIAVTLATFLIGMPVRFGILHLLAFCMLLYGFLGRTIERLPEKLVPALWISMLIASALGVRYIALPGQWFWPFGWTYADFYSSDYFPIFPWVFVFLLGAWAGAPIRGNRLPKWFYEVRPPIFPAIGRHALIIYLAHQPVLYGITMLISWLIG